MLPAGCPRRPWCATMFPEKVIPIQAVPTGVESCPRVTSLRRKSGYGSAQPDGIFPAAPAVVDARIWSRNPSRRSRTSRKKCATSATRPSAPPAKTENSLELRTRDPLPQADRQDRPARSSASTTACYGYCVDTGDRDRPGAALEARLTAERTIDAQERWEHRQKQMGD